MSARTQLPSGSVTFLFTDIEGSTRLAQTLGVAYRTVLIDHRRILRRTLSARAGVELCTEGDSFFFVFWEAGAALAACLAAQRELDRHQWPDPGIRPRVRMGLHTGWAMPVGGEYASTEVHRAARIADAAHGGQILCSAATAGLVSYLPDQAQLVDLGLYRLRGFDGREQLFQLVAPDLEHGFPRPRTAAASHNLPAPLTSFIGREQEQAMLTRLLAGHRLVTVAGTGGAGKTRLAVQVAGARVDAYPDGVWFLDLATVTDSGLVTVTLAAALGTRPEPGRPVLETLAEYIAGKRLLLVLDTCDAHIAAVRTTVSKLLAGADEVQVLATSREPIGLPGEVVWRIPALSLEPRVDGAPGDAVALLAERTAAARGGRSADPAELPHLTRIATRLNGLPLALELAAGRLRVVSAGQLAQRMDTELAGEPVDLLGTLDAGQGGSPDRHATLESAVNWSYRTLTPGSAKLLRWLSVFATPVDLGTAEWLCADDPLHLLTVLVDKSLLHVEPTTAGTSFRMLDPIRSYAQRALVAAGEGNAARDQHVAWLQQALQRTLEEPDGRPRTLSLRRLDALVDEVRAALRWCVTGGTAGPGLRLVRGLEQWWRERGLAREGRLWLFRLYGRIAETGEAIDEAELAAAYHAHSLHAGADGEVVEQLRFSHRAEAAARRSGHDGLVARVLAGRGPALLDLGRPAEAEQASREAIDWATRHGVIADAVLASCCLAQLRWRWGDYDEAAELLGKARAAEATRADIRGRRTVDLLLGMVALGRGDLVAGHDHLVVALRSRMEFGFYGRACESLNAMAVRCAIGHDLDVAARLFGAADANRSRLQCHPGYFGGFWQEQQAKVRAQLGDAEFDVAYASGSRLSLAAASAVALAVDHPDLTCEHAERRIFHTVTPTRDPLRTPTPYRPG